MRTLALSGFAALAISMMAPAAVWAWSSEPAAPTGADGSNLAEADDPLKALQDKVDAKSGFDTGSQSGFYFGGSAAARSLSPLTASGRPRPIPASFRLVPDARVPRAASIAAAPQSRSIGVRQTPPFARRIVIPDIGAHRHPGQAKRRAGIAKKNERCDLLRSRIRLRLSGTTINGYPGRRTKAIRWRSWENSA